MQYLVEEKHDGVNWEQTKIYVTVHFMLLYKYIIQVLSFIYETKKNQKKKWKKVKYK